MIFSRYIKEKEALIAAQLRLAEAKSKLIDTGIALYENIQLTIDNPEFDRINELRLAILFRRIL